MDWETPHANGRGMITEDVPADAREGMAEEIGAKTRERRRTEWTAE